MFFSRLQVAGGKERSRAFWEAAGDLYDLHKAVWGLFADGPDRERDFLYRVDSVLGRPVIYTVSERAPVDATGIFSVEIKPYEPVIRTGQHFSFMIRANPVVTKKDNEGKHHRHDVVMDMKKKLGDDASDCEPAEIITRAGSEWLSSRAKIHGFLPDSSRTIVEGYQQHRFRTGKGRSETRFSTLDFTGVLVVTDPDLFREVLYQGLGPAKGFGCGMFMVRPTG